MAHQDQSKARQSQRRRQAKRTTRSPVSVKKRTGTAKVKSKLPPVKAGIPVGLAALVAKQKAKAAIKKIEQTEKKKAGSQNSPFQKVNPPKFTAIGKLGKLSV